MFESCRAHGRQPSTFLGIRGERGFVVHANGPVPGGRRVTEVWNSQADFESWFERRYPGGSPAACSSLA
jgi:hypothetical protein